MFGPDRSITSHPNSQFGCYNPRKGETMKIKVCEIRDIPPFDGNIRNMVCGNTWARDPEPRDPFPVTTEGGFRASVIDLEFLAGIYAYDPRFEIDVIDSPQYPLTDATIEACWVALGMVEEAPYGQRFTDAKRELMPFVREVAPDLLQE